MKSIVNISKGLLSVALLSTAFVSCSEDKMDQVNKDVNHTLSVPSKFILADVLTSTAFSNQGGDFNTYMSTYVEHEVGISNQLYSAEKRQGEPSSSSTFNNSWINIYGTLKNARIIISKCSEDGDQAGNYTTKGIGEVMAALNAGIIADAFGDAPYTEAALPNLVNGMPEFMNPKVDRQETIYTDILTTLDNAIADLPQGDVTRVGNYDFLYNGDVDLWTKFAYGLKARYTMHLLNRSSDVEGDLEKVLEYVSKSFTSADEQAAYAQYDASNLNPLFDFQWSRDYLAASQSLCEKFIERNDPRLRRAFINTDWVQVTGTEDETYLVAPNGDPEPMQYYYNTSVFTYAQTAPTLLLSYHEVLFLKAEALARLNRIEEAEATLKEAISAAIANLEVSVKAAMNAPSVLVYGGLTETTTPISSEEIDTYFETNVKPLFKANPLKEVMVQKYLAFFGASGESTECYNDIRRMKAANEDFITLKNTNKFPLRLPYGGDDVAANPNVEAAFGDGQYVYTEPVWWAGGSR